VTSVSNTIKSVLILGGSSEIGVAIAHRFADQAVRVVLASRLPGPAIEAIPPERATWHRFDVLNVEAHAAFLDAIGELPDVVVCAIGLGGKQVELAAHPAAARRVMETNYLAPALLIGEIASRMEARNRGTIVGISSVAGDRGRASNYIYGSAKAGFTEFLSALAQQRPRRHHQTGFCWYASDVGDEPAAPSDSRALGGSRCCLERAPQRA
jgi:decaprenylphospho-beta-D-erythro-pentofuranosid-2-ulose 2-reductase